MKKKNMIAFTGVLGVIAIGFVANTMMHHTSADQVKSKGVPATTGMTLQQAQSKLPFSIAIPAKLPEGMQFEYATVGQSTITGTTGKSVVLVFGTEDKQKGFVLIEQQGNMGHLHEGEVTKVKVNQANAEFSVLQKQPEVSLLWQQGKMTYKMYSDSKGDQEVGTAEGLIKIASSVQ